jgi:hypothetical protein
MAAVTAEKAAREAQLVELVVECHRLFRILKWEPDQPLDYQILSSLDPFVEEHKLVSQHVLPNAMHMSNNFVTLYAIGDKPWHRSIRACCEHLLAHVC